jgi:hypothetical protein
MLKTGVLLLLTLCLAGLSGCGGAPETASAPEGPIRGPGDEQLFEAVTAYVAANNRPPSSTYDHARVDLNGDGFRDALVLFKFPHQSWCGWDGCGMAIFRANRDSFTPIASMSGIRGPVHVRAKGHHGWRDIIVRISGTEARGKNVTLAYDGTTYPRHPMAAPTMQIPLSSLETETFFR